MKCARTLIVLLMATVTVETKAQIICPEEAYSQLGLQSGMDRLGAYDCDTIPGDVVFSPNYYVPGDFYYPERTLDTEPFANIKVIHGKLRVLGKGVTTDLAHLWDGLRNLEEVGSIEMDAPYGAVDATTRLGPSFPSLVRVNGDIVTDPGSTQHTSGLYEDLAVWNIDMPNLQVVAGSIDLRRDAIPDAKPRLIAPNLVEVGGDLLLGLERFGNPDPRAPASHNLSSLATVGNDFKTHFVLDSPSASAGLGETLQTVGGDLVVRVSESLAGFGQQIQANRIHIINDGESFLDLAPVGTSIGLGSGLFLRGAFTDLSVVRAAGQLKSLRWEQTIFSEPPDLNGVTAIEGELYLNGSLQVVDTLTDLQSVGGNLHLWDRSWDSEDELSSEFDELKNWDGLRSLETVGGSILRVTFATIDPDPPSCDGFLRLVGYPSGPPGFTGSHRCRYAYQTNAPSGGAIIGTRSGDRAIEVDFTPATKLGTAFPVLDTQLACEDDNGTHYEAHGVTSPIRLEGLSNGETYTCQLDARLELGIRSGSFSEAVFQRTPESVTSAPLPPYISDVLGGSEAADFLVKVNEAWDFITRAKVTCSAAGASLSGTTDFGIVNPGISKDGTLVRVTGLELGTSYSCSATVSNEYGESAPSADFNIEIIQAPASPTIYLTEYDDSLLRLYISEGDDGGDPDSYVEATCIGPAGAVSAQATEGAGTFGSGSVHVAEFLDLTNGAEYTCSAVTLNSAGSSLKSNVVRETPRGKPYAPVITQATGGFSEIVLDFEADNRGAEIESLTYECSNLTRETVTAEANITEATVELHRLIIEGLPNAQTYTCSIAVSNSEGTSPMSAPSAAVTTGKVCDQENVSFSSQAELDSFAADCSEISGHLSLSNVSNIEKLSVLTDLGGDLRIRNTQITDVSDLSGLRFGGGTLEVRFNENMSDLSGFSSLTSLQGDLLIDDGTLQSLSGLDNLASVGGSVYLSSMSSLTSLQGLGSLASVGGDFDLSGAIVTSFSGLGSLATVPGNFAASLLPELQSMSGLENLTSVGGRLYVGDNPKLTDLSGLGSLQTLGDELVLYNNPSLANIDTFEKLNSIGGGVQISNTALTTINAFINLASFQGSFVVTDNPALRNVDGLFSLTEVSGSLLISNNDALRTLDGLGNIGEVGLDFTVTENSTLANCTGAAALLGYPNGPPDDTVGGDITFSGNAAGCNSITAVLDSVQGISTPVITSAEAGNNSVTLTYTANAGDAAFPIKEYSGVCVGADFEFAESPSEPILDNQLVERSYSVSGYDPSTAAPDVTIDINISHDDPIELSVDLISPNGTVVSLWDKADTPDTQIVASYEFRGDETFPGESVDGAWKLRILDDETGPLAKEGVLNSWGMTLREEHVASSTDTSMTFTGLTNGRTYTCSVTAKSNLNSFPTSDPIEVTPTLPPLGSALTPDFASPASTVNGFTVQVTNYDSEYSWSVSSTAGSVSINGAGLISVTGLMPEQSATVTASTSREGYDSGTATVIGVALPAYLPSSPKIIRIDAEDGEVLVWIEVLDDGGGTITEYRATCTDGTNTFVGTSTTNRVLVTRLSNDVPYTCTASITTEAGTSEESAESPPVIPEEAMSGLPIWLLYEASKPN